MVHAPIPQASSTWTRQDATSNVSWFYTVEGASVARSWFRTTVPAKPGQRLAAFTLTDDKDTCPSTSAGSVVNASGCSIADLCPCEKDWKNHGQYVSCVTKTSQDFIKAKLITKEAGASLVSTAAKAACGK